NHMDSISKARMFVSHIKSLDDFIIVDEIDGSYNHMGATIADAILQAGTNYATVVEPRVNAILKTYPDARTTTAFRDLLERVGVKEVLSWKDDEKPNRVLALTEFLLSEGIDTEQELRNWISADQNRERIQVVHGVGPKTADYLRILVGFQTAAVDRYVYRLLEEAGIATVSYEDAREILNLAADSLGVERSRFDHSVWKHMSQRKEVRRSQNSSDQGIEVNRSGT
ncbi:MAG: hypothetical protein ACC700_16340, partial [Anaerolineales bacterium]